MSHHLSLETARQSLVFFPNQGISHRHLYDNIAGARPERTVAKGETLGRAVTRAVAAVAAYFERSRVRR